MSGETHKPLWLLFSQQKTVLLKKGLTNPDSSWRGATFCFRFLLKTDCSFSSFFFSVCILYCVSDPFPSRPSLPPPFPSTGGDIKVWSYPKLHIVHYKMKSIQMDVIFGFIYPFFSSTNDKLLPSPPRERRLLPCNRLPVKSMGV